MIKEALILTLPRTALGHRHRLPRKPGVYYAVSMLRPFRPLYIGMSGNLHKRWNSESNPHHKLWQLRSVPMPFLYYRTTTSRAKAEELESYEIRRFKPPLNQRDESPERYGLRFQVYLLRCWTIETLAIALPVWGIALILLLTQSPS